MRRPPHQMLVRLLIGLASLFAVLSIFAIWAERQLLDTDEWVDTSSRLFEDDEIQAELQSYLVDELFRYVDVQAELQRGLPPEAQTLAAPLSSAVQQLADDAAKRALESPRIADAWIEANREAHAVLLNLVEGDGELVSSRGGVVALDLAKLIDELTVRLGIGADVASQLPRDVAQLEVLASDEIETAREIVEAIRGLALVLTLATLLAFGLAIHLARGRRQLTLFWVGLGLAGAGIAVYVIRTVAGDALVDELVESQSAVAAADAAWSISTSLLSSIATTVIVLGALCALASWLAAPVASAAATRRVLAPVLRDRPAAIYALLVAVALIYFALAPSHGLRTLITVMALTVAAALGIRALRHQAISELAAVPAVAPEDEPRAGQDERLDRLERLARLREQGILSDEELAAEKARILGAG